jgi:single-strand DNA-binding protein
MPNHATSTLIGYLGRDPETRPTSGDGTVTTLSLGVTRTHKINGEQRPETTWWRVAIWGTRGKTAAQHLRKGSCVICTGWPVLRKYRDHEGKEQAQVELLNADWTFGEGKQSATSQNAKTTNLTDVSASSDTPSPTAAVGNEEPPF